MKPQTAQKTAIQTTAAQASRSSVNALLAIAGAHGEQLEAIDQALGAIARAINELSARLAALEAVAPSPDDGDGVQ